MIPPKKICERTDGVHVVLVEEINPKWAEWAEARIAELEKEKAKLSQDVQTLSKAVVITENQVDIDEFCLVEQATRIAELEKEVLILQERWNARKPKEN